MGQLLHGCARTTEAIRHAIPNSQESVKALAVRYGINPKTVVKWRRRTTVKDAPMGPKEPTSTVLTKAEEALIVAFRKHTLLPLDDCLYALQSSIPLDTLLVAPLFAASWHQPSSGLRRQQATGEEKIQILSCWLLSY